MKVTLDVKLGKVQTPQPPSGNAPVAVPETEILDSTYAGPGEVYGVIRTDNDRSEHGGSLGQTNAVRPNRPVESDGRVGRNSKIICKIEHTTWADWLLDLSGGFENFKQIATPGDGYMDTIEAWPDDKPLGSIEDYDNLPLMSCPTGCQLVHIVDEVFHNGWWDVIETLDFNSPPQNINGVWHYKGKAINPRNAPHLFYARVNRVVTNFVTWLTRHGINAANDGGVQGGKGEEYRPGVSNKVAAQPRELIRRYPETGTKARLYKNSVIVDGELVPQQGGIEVTIGAYRYQWSDTYIQDANTGKWYLADEMLVTADASQRYPGNGFDYRCYATLLNADGSPKGSPWMDYLWFRAPRCGWVGLRGDFHLLEESGWAA